MRLTKKTIVLAVALLAIITTGVFGTIAYLTDSTEVTNTFSIGKVDITVDETVVNKDGLPVDKNGNVIVDQEGNPIEMPSDNRTEQGNKYPMIPGKTYVKDPTMTVKKDSEPAFYRMLVTLNNLADLNTIYPNGFELSQFVVGLDTTNWVLKGAAVPDATADTITYEYRYAAAVDASAADVKLPALFTNLTIPTFFDSEELEKLQDLSITVEGNAIQQTGFADADEAWTAFDAQLAAKNENQQGNTPEGGDQGNTPEGGEEGGEQGT